MNTPTEGYKKIVLSQDEIEERDINRKKVYIASPFFTPDQIVRVSLVETLLEKLGIKYFSPRKELVCPPTATDKQRTDAFEGNIKGIEDSSMVICITDGKDMGTVFEAGVAYAKNIPVIGVAFTLGDNPFNLMLSESCTTTCKTVEEIEDYLTNGTKNYYQGLIE